MNILDSLNQFTMVYCRYILSTESNNTTRRRGVSIPKEISLLTKDIPTIKEAETMQVTANVWVAMNKFPRPFPSLKRFIPAVCAFWNAVKGGSDTATKLMDDRSLRVPKGRASRKQKKSNLLLYFLFSYFSFNTS